MKVVIPISRHSDCPLFDEEHMAKVEIHTDEFGVTDEVCPEHGRTGWFEPLEFDSEEAAEAWLAKRPPPDQGRTAYDQWIQSAGKAHKREKRDG